MDNTVLNLLGQIKQSNLNSFHAFSYQQLTITGAAVQRLTIPEGAKYALMSLESNIATTAARYLETNQTAVAAGVGMPLSNGSVFDITDAQNLAGFQIIQESANTTKLNIQYYK